MLRQRLWRHLYPRHSSMTGERVQLTDCQLGILMSQQATKALLAGEKRNLLAEGALSCPFWTLNNNFFNHCTILTYS
jgi:hypothetical protein